MEWSLALGSPPGDQLLRQASLLDHRKILGMMKQKKKKTNKGKIKVAKN